MDPVSPASYVMPSPRIPKVLGILNIVFASALMICGLCSIAYYASIPVFSKTMVKLQKDVEAKEKAERKLVLKSLDEEEEEATTDEAKAEVRERRERFEAEPLPPTPPTVDFGMMGLEGPEVKGYVWTEFVSGLILNLLLMTSGIGLVMRKSWGLKLGLGVAALKLVRLFLVYGYAALVLAPKIALGMAKFQIQAIEQQQRGKPMPPGFDIDIMTRAMTIWMVSCAVGMIVIGSIYPLISLWLLSRPGARAACSDQPQAKGQGQDESW